MSIWVKNINNIYKVGLNYNCILNSNYRLSTIKINNFQNIIKNKPFIELIYDDYSNVIINSPISGTISKQNVKLLNNIKQYIFDTSLQSESMDLKPDLDENNNLWLVEVYKNIHYNGLYYENVSINSSDGSKSSCKSSSS